MPSGDYSRRILIPSTGYFIMAGCPFMAIYEATKHQQSNTGIPLCCPVSGRHIAVATVVSGKAFGDQTDDDTVDANWRQSGTSHLEVIREDAEMVLDSPTDESNPGNKDDDSPRPSRTGSIGSMRSSSHIGSLASGIHANIPGGSR